MFKWICIPAVLLILSCVSTPAHKKSANPEAPGFDRRPSAAGVTLPPGIAYVDLRDLVDFHTRYAGLAQIIVNSITDSTDRFVGGGGRIKLHLDGTRGPAGHIEGTEFKTDESFESTRRDAILSVAIESITEVEADKIFDVSLLFFTHDSSRKSSPYFFRRLKAQANFDIPRTQPEARVKVTSAITDLPLNETSFVLRTDLLGRKMIAEDKTHQIWMVFPVHSASLDIHTEESMDGKVTTMTGEWPDAVLKSVRLTGVGHEEDFLNTRQRNWPPYFQGRPYFALYVNGKTAQRAGADYLGIYGIFRGRAFSTLGGIRLRDQDIYIVDALLNEGSQKEIPVQVLNTLPGYEALEPALPTDDQAYEVVVYTRAPVSQVVCRSPFQTIAVSQNGNLRTLFDDDCSTRRRTFTGGLETVLSYAKGAGGPRPKTPVQ